MEKVQKHCSNCDTKYSVEWNEEEQELEPLTCPFFFFLVEDEEEVECVNHEDKEEDNWN